LKRRRKKKREQRTKQRQQELAFLRPVAVGAYDVDFPLLVTHDPPGRLADTHTIGHSVTNKQTGKQVSSREKRRRVQRCGGSFEVL
jgi:hypothetical protein